MHVPRPIKTTVAGIARWTNVQRALVIALIASPLIMALFDWFTSTRPFGFRATISDYYTPKDPVMGSPPAFYVPLIVAAMLFVVNGVIDDARAWNVVLGVLLALVVVFNKDGFPYIHYPAAIGFYAGNAWMVAKSNDPDRWRKGMILGLGGWVLLYWVVFGASIKTALFWAEWFGLALIGIHFAFDSTEGGYGAPRADREWVQATAS